MTVSGEYHGIADRIVEQMIKDSVPVRAISIPSILGGTVLNRRAGKRKYVTHNVH